MRKVLLNRSWVTVLSPVFFGVSFVLTFFAQNNGQLFLRSLSIPLIITVIFGLVVVKVSILLLKDRPSGIVFASIFAIAFFSFGQIVGLIDPFLTSRSLFLPWGLPVNDVLGTVYLFILLGTFLVLKKGVFRLDFAVRFVFVVSLVSVVIPMALITVFEFKQKISLDVSSPSPVPAASSSLPTSKLPDIYYIVPEDYSSPTVMKNFFQADDKEFLESMADRGFYYASQSASNYPKSFLSLASAMNMEYLDYLSVFKNSTDQSLVTPLVENSKVLQFLRGLGYSFYQMGSWWFLTKYNPYADWNFILERQHQVNISDFDYAVLQSTMLRPFIDKVIPPVVITDSDADKRRRILYQFETIPDIVTLPGPKFVFIHIIAPHDPWIFDQDCKFIDNKVSSKLSDEQNYANQAACFNEKLENAIDQIVDQSPRPPVILIQSDEGAPFLGRKVNPADNWKIASNDLLKEKFPIFAFYYLPGKTPSKAGLYPSITSVNAFRVILNAYFGTKLPLLPDREYIFADINHLYEFIDVTEKLKQ